MNARPLPVYYVSAHSKIPKKSVKHIDRIPDNTYLIMTTECGRYSYPENQNFLHKWISTADGVQRLKNLVKTGDHPLFINGKRIYRPGSKDRPVNQVLGFTESKRIRETFYLGITRAPVNLQTIKTNALNRIRALSKSKLVEAFNAVKNIYDRERTNSEKMRPIDLINEISRMITIMMTGGTRKHVSTEQLEKVIMSRKYRNNLLVSHDVPFEYIIRGNKLISDLLKESGSGIYIIDTCRGIAKIDKNNGSGTTTVFPSKRQKYRHDIEFPVGTFSTYVNPELGPENRRLIERRLKLSKELGNYYRRKEKGENPSPPRGSPVNRQEI